MENKDPKMNSEDIQNQIEILLKVVDHLEMLLSIEKEPSLNEVIEAAAAGENLLDKHTQLQNADYKSLFELESANENIQELELDQEISESVSIEDKLDLKEELVNKNLESEHSIEEELTEENIYEEANEIKSMRYNANNGLVGQAYSFDLKQLDFSDIGITEIEIVDILPRDGISLEEIGLQFNTESKEITGLPSKEGDFMFEMDYILEGLDEGFKIKPIERILNIIINPDPRSLWQTNEPPEGSLFPKEHFLFNTFDFFDYKIFGASLRGRSHAHKGTYRDDHFIIKALEQDVLLLAVADGAGSAKYSRQGSELACNACFDSIANNLQEKYPDFVADLKAIDFGNEALPRSASDMLYDVIANGVKDARDKLIRFSKEQEHELKDYSTTFLITLITKLEDRYCIVSYGIGDGVIALVGEEKVDVLNKPDGGAFAGQTRFLTMSDAISEVYDRIQIKFKDHISDLFLMTDGVSDPFFETEIGR
ncbi:MAG: PP2C family serine/threonine-protein phosphatase, partial [Bacteroidota bacterium]